MWKTDLPEETYNLGRMLAQLIKSGDMICLVGELGAGKTILTQGICSGLGIKEDVTSPTFTVVNVYEAANTTVYHFDLYRLDNSEELYDIGFYEYINSGGISFVEWSDKFFAEVPEDYLLIEIKYAEIQTQRLIAISAQGSRYCGFNEELKNIVGSGYRYCNPCI